MNLHFLLYFIIGGIEWLLALLRTSFHVQGKRLLTSIIVFLEVILGFFVFEQFMTSGMNYWVVIWYALGSSVGAYFAGRKGGGKDNTP